MQETSSKKPLIYVLLGVVILIIVGIVLMQNSEPKDPYEGLVTYVEPEFLTEEQIAEYEAQIEAYKLEIAEKEAAGTYVLDVYFQLGFYEYQLGLLKEAFETYTIVNEGDPDNETAWNNLGDIRIRMGDINGAEEYYLGAIENDQLSQSRYEKIYRYWDEHRPDRHDQIGPMLELGIERISAAGGQPVSLYTKLGAWLIEEGRYDEAVEAYAQANLFDPDNMAIQEDLEAAIDLQAAN